MANENVIDLLLRAREAAEEASSLLSDLENAIYDCDAEEIPSQIYYWDGFTEVKRREAMSLLREALEKFEACEKAIPKEEE